MNTFKFKMLSRSLLAVSLSSALFVAPVASASNVATWKPVSHEKLITLPANFISRKIDNDFNESALAAQINALDERMTMAVNSMKKLKVKMADVTGDEHFELSHQFLEAKSDYLDFVEQKQKLDQQAMNIRRKLYERVLKQIRRNKEKNGSAEMVKLQKDQQRARKRMEQAKSLVDNALLEAGNMEGSKYSGEYNKNINQLEALKAAINSHEANRAPAIDGQEVTKEGYVRHLLAGLNAEQAIFDQEKLMLTYMAKLVSLDAQSLEHKLMAGPEGEEDYDDSTSRGRLASNADLFIE